MQAIERQPWSGSNSTATNSEKAKAASESKGRIRGFGGPKKRSVVQSQRQEEGGWRLGMEGKRSKEPMGRSGRRHC